MDRQSVTRRAFFKGAAASLACTALAGCASQPVIVKETVEVPVLKERTVVVQQPTNLAFWTFVGREEEAIVKLFMDEFPHISVEMSEIGDAVFGSEKFLTAVAAGKGPDVAIQGRHTFMQFSAKGLYQDITPYFDNAGMKKSDFMPVQIAETSWDGKIYGLPRETDTRLLYWNKKHFQEVGLDPSKPPTTYAELEAYAEQLNKKDSAGNWQRMGFVPYLVGNSWMWLYAFLNKAPAISEDKRTILCDDPRWVEALDWMVRFYDKYLGSFEITSAFTAGVTGPLPDHFIMEMVSMVAHCDTIVGHLLRKPDLDWDVAPMPIPPGGEQMSWSCGWSIVMAPSSKAPEASWEFMRWWTGLEGWRARAKVYKEETARMWEREQIQGEPLYYPWDAVYLPAIKMLEEEYISQLPELLKKHWALSMDCLTNWTRGCGTEMGVAALQYWVEVDNAVRAALAHKMSPQEALAQAKAKVQEATDQAWQAIDTKKS
ncbi:MAG: ABC transporter substrate-binding protein [Anaerolineae bacterium]